MLTLNGDVLSFYIFAKAIYNIHSVG